MVNGGKIYNGRHQREKHHGSKSFLFKEKTFFVSLFLGIFHFLPTSHNCSILSLYISAHSFRWKADAERSNLIHLPLLLYTMSHCLNIEILYN